MFYRIPSKHLVVQTVMDIVPVSILFTLNRFNTLFWCFHYWLWTSECRLGSCCVILNKILWKKTMTDQSHLLINLLVGLQLHKRKSRSRLSDWELSFKCLITSFWSALPDGYLWCCHLLPPILFLETIYKFIRKQKPDRADKLQYVKTSTRKYTWLTTSWFNLATRFIRASSQSKTLG